MLPAVMCPGVLLPGKVKRGGESLSHFCSAAFAACRICPKKKFSGPVDETLLGPAQAADSSSSEASATDSSSPQAPAGNSKADSFATPDSPEAGADSSDTALRPGGGGTAGSKWDFTLPALPVQYISRVEDLRDVPTGDMYVQPPMNFAAIDSIAILGGTAYLMQITQDIKHDLNVGLLSVLACLPAHLEVRFVWALPAQVWASKTFNSRDVPQIDDLSPPAPTSRARTKKRTGTAEGSLSAASESADDGTAAEMRMSGVGKQAIKKLVDRDVALVETRLAACEMQFKMAVHVICSAPRNPPQTPTQGRPQASLSTTSSMSKSAASAVLMSRLVRFLPRLSPLSSHSNTLNIKAQMGTGDMQTARWLHWHLPVHL